MKMNDTFHSPFLFNPELSFAGRWPAARPSKTRSYPRAVPVSAETQIGYKQEFVCGVILMLCLLFGLAAFIAQFTLA